MRYNSRAIYLYNQDIIHHTDLFAIHKLHLALVAHNVYGQAYAVTGIDVPRLGDELDEERHALYMRSRLGMYIPRNNPPRPRITPLPLFCKTTQFGIALSGSNIHHSSS